MCSMPSHRPSPVHSRFLSTCVTGLNRLSIERKEIMKVIVVGNIGYAGPVVRDIFVKPIGKLLSSDLTQGFLLTGYRHLATMQRRTHEN